MRLLEAGGNHVTGGGHRRREGAVGELSADRRAVDRDSLTPPSRAFENDKMFSQDTLERGSLSFLWDFVPPMGPESRLSMEERYTRDC